MGYGMLRLGKLPAEKDLSSTVCFSVTMYNPTADRSSDPD